MEEKGEKGESNKVTYVDKLLVNEVEDRHLNKLVRLYPLLLKTETLNLVKVRRRLREMQMKLLSYIAHHTYHKYTTHKSYT